LLEELRSKTNEIAQQEERMRIQQEAIFQAEFERKRKMRKEMEALFNERVRMDEMQRIARLENVRAIEDTIQSAMSH
jgi:membrane protein involved in colicin uptake